MLRNLNDAFNAAKRDRQVLSKLIIWESGVSKSQFYRIIKGKEAPSLESKNTISKALNIDLTEFDRLHKLSKIEHETDTTPKHKTTPKVIGLAVCICLLGFFFLLINSGQTEPTPNINIVQENDHTLFIKDVTIPDGTQIPINTTYVKTWRVKNIGAVIWKNRYLKRITPASDLLCSSPAMVPIPETLPGETIDISVTFTTPHLPGSCRTDWKAADDRGNLYFPDMHGLFSIVIVVDD